jgi:hypothetical protein
MSYRMKPIIYKHHKIVLKPVPGSGKINARCQIFIDGQEIGEASSFLALSFAVDHIDAQPVVSEGTLARMRARK